MYWFAYGLMTARSTSGSPRQVEKFVPTPMPMASLLATYAAQNARSEAIAIAASPETKRALRAMDSPPRLKNFAPTNPRCKVDLSWL